MSKENLMSYCKISFLPNFPKSIIFCRRYMTDTMNIYKTYYSYSRVGYVTLAAILKFIIFYIQCLDASVYTVPLLNLAVSGILSALIALLFDLEKLVEFMSIGTLLAYTIVSASVIILRYKTDHPDQKEIKDGDDVSVSTASTQSDSSCLLQAGSLKPEFYWLSHLVNGCGHNEVISACVLIFISCSAVLCAYVHFSTADILFGEWWAVLILIFLTLCALGCLLLIGAHKQNPSNNNFRVPWVPLIPGLSILCNVGLMVHLNVLTWVRFAVWMTLGLLVYFSYGIKHSKEGEQTNTYFKLTASSEAHKEPWGTMSTRENPEESKSPADQKENSTEPS